MKKDSNTDSATEPSMEQLEAEHEAACEQMRRRAAGATSVDVPLGVSISFEGRTVSKLTLRRPNAGDLIEGERKKLSEYEKVVFLVQRTAHIPPEAVAMLDLADFDLVEAAFQGFRGTRIRRAG